MSASCATTKPAGSSPLMSDMGEFAVHSEQVLVWRKESFDHMGFSELLADFLASTRIDLHRMRSLLAAGCTHDLAAQILMGTTYSGDDDQWHFTDEEASHLKPKGTKPKPRTKAKAKAKVKASSA